LSFYRRLLFQAKQKFPADLKARFLLAKRRSRPDLAVGVSRELTLPEIIIVESPIIYSYLLQFIKMMVVFKNIEIYL
jgi:hypothetical protein